MKELARVIDEFNDALRPEQFGTSKHYPYCQHWNCTGCIPDLPELRPPVVDPDQDPFGLLKRSER